ncbi:MAG: hypothetical protein ACTHMB_10190 [Candidatus Binatia bacterium]
MFSKIALSTPSSIRPARVSSGHRNLENIARDRYNSEAGTMVVEKRPNFRGAA